MDWNQLRQKIYNNKKISIDKESLAKMLFESYERIEDLEDRLRKVEDKQNAQG